MFARICGVTGLLIGLWTTQATASTTCSTGTLPVTICIVTDALGVFNTANNVTYAWDSSVQANKGLTITFACASARAGFTFTVKDEIGTAESFPITVTAQPGDTIDAPGGGTGHNTFVLNSNFESITFQCDGAGNTSAAGNWLVE